MNQPSPFKTIHGIGVALAAAMVAVFFWSTLGAAAFNGPTENPSAGNGAIYSDSSNNVYIGGNLNVSGTISGADLGGSTISAANVSAADFGSNTGGGQFTFPGWLSVGSDSPGGDYDSALLIQDTGNDPADGAVLAIDYNNDYLSNDNTGDLIIGGDGSNSIDIGTNGSADLAVASSGNVGIGTTNPLSTLDVYGGQLLVRDNDNGANVGDGVRIGYDGTSGFGSPSIGFRASDQSERFEISVPSSSMNTANERISISGDCSGGCLMTEYLSVNRYGDVGIGTTSPSQLLDVEGNAANIKLVDTGASGSTGYLNTKFGSTAGNLALQNSGNVILAPGNGYALTALTDGDVGIGTTTPGYLLTVNGTTSAAAYCISGANCITAWPSGGSTGANPSASIGTSAVNGSATTFMRSDGAPAINQAAAFSFSALGNTTSTANISALTFKENGTAVSTSTGANPSGSLGTTAVNGSANTFMRSDGAPAINQAAAFSFSALGNTTSTANISAASFNETGGATTASTITLPTIIGSCTSSTVTITGATSSTGAVFVSPVVYPGNGYIWQGYVSSLNTVVIEICAATSTTGTAAKFSAIYIR